MEFLVIIFIVIAIVNSITKDKGKVNKQNVSVGNSNVLQTVTGASSVSTVARNTTEAPVQKTVNSVKQSAKQNVKKQTVPNIVQKAKSNNAKLAKDQTLEDIEKLHGHSERAVSQPVEHSSVCQTLKKEENTLVASESLLGNIDDLMIKGYSGDLKFERDFVSEGLSMISEFIVPDSVNF